MTRTKRNSSIVSPAVVRAVAVILLLLDGVLAAVLAINLGTFGWLGGIILAVVLATMYFPIKAIQTGDPEWVLLDLILGP
jgi:hypothetical protein